MDQLPKISTEQKLFNSKPNKLEEFITECDMVFNIKSDTYCKDEHKIAYVLQLMTSEMALEWKSTYVLHNYIKSDIWDLFKDQLCESFQNIER